MRGTTPLIIYRGKPKTNSWARWMVGRTMKRNQNNLVGVIGKTGSGKTLSAISICEIMSRMDGVPFGIDNIVFSLRELMDLINSGKLQRGSKIIFDEPQVSISARDFQSQANKVFNFLLTTFRHRNLSLFFCTPFETLLDKNTRKLFHARFETMSINKNTQTCRLKPRYIEYSDFRSEPYRKQLIVVSKDNSGNGTTKKVFHWDVPRPSKELEQLYEQKKKEFTDRLNKNISERLKKFDETGNSITADNEIKPKPVRLDDNGERLPLTPQQTAVMKLIAKGLTYMQIKERLGIATSVISGHKKRVLKKGYKLREFLEEIPQEKQINSLTGDTST